MHLRITVDGAEQPDHLRSLREWLGHVAQLRGRVGTVERPPAPGTLGPVLDALMIALAPGGVAAALAPALVSWLRERRSDVTLRIGRRDGTTVEVTAARVRGLDAAELRAYVEQLARALRGDEGDDPPPDGRPGDD